MAPIAVLVMVTVAEVAALRARGRMVVAARTVRVRRMSRRDMGSVISDGLLPMSFRCYGLVSATSYSRELRSPLVDKHPRKQATACHRSALPAAALKHGRAHAGHALGERGSPAPRRVSAPADTSVRATSADESHFEVAGSPGALRGRSTGQAE